MERQLVNTRQCGQVTIAIMPENIDSANSATVQGELLKLCQGTGKLLCDFAANKYVSSAGLRVFLEVLNAVEERSGALCLFGMNAVVFEVFDITGFTDMMQVRTTEAEALAAVE